MALDTDPGVEAVASQPMWLPWVSESGRARRHAPDFFVRCADGTGVLVDVRSGDRISAADSAVFAATAAMAGQAGWACNRVGELPAVRAANLRWLAASSLALFTLIGLKVLGVLQWPWWLILLPLWISLGWMTPGGFRIRWLRGAAGRCRARGGVLR